MGWPVCFWLWCECECSQIRLLCTSEPSGRFLSAQTYQGQNTSCALDHAKTHSREEQTHFCVDSSSKTLVCHHNSPASIREVIPKRLRPENHRESQWLQKEWGPRAQGVPGFPGHPCRACRQGKYLSLRTNSTLSTSRVCLLGHPVQGQQTSNLETTLPQAKLGWAPRPRSNYAVKTCSRLRLVLAVKRENKGKK